MKNPNKCLNCGCDIHFIKKGNVGIIRHNFIKYSCLGNEEVICIKCYNQGIDFNNYNKKEVKK